jgi:hypothetical protein
MRSGHGVSELGEDGQVNVQPDARETAHPQGERAPLVLEPAELALDAAALVVETLPPGSATRDERVQPGRLDPHTDAGSHSPDGQRHLAAPRLASDPANVHVPWSHDGGWSLPALTAGSRAAGSRAACGVPQRPRR